MFSLLVTFFGLLLVTFVIGRLMPADPVLAAVGDRASVSTYNQVRAEMGLDLPIWHQFLIYAWKVLHGDFGMSILTAQPVLEDIAGCFPPPPSSPPSASSSASSSASRSASGRRSIATACWTTSCGFWASSDIRCRSSGSGIMGLLVFYLKLEWVGGPGRLDVYLDGEVPTVTGMILVDSLLAGDWEVFDNAFSHIILPATLLGYYSLAYICRMTRSLMLEQLNQEYLITARVKGLSERRVIWRHAFGNIQVPLITVVALAFANILEGSVLTETVFAWPGIGRYITTALLAADMNAVLGGTVVVGAGLYRHESAVGPALPDRGSPGAMSVNPTSLAVPTGLKAWLLTDTPGSGWQAACGRAFRGWRSFARNPLGLVGLGIVVILLLCAAFAPWIATADPTSQDLALRLQPPSEAHWLGTDRMGRDTFSNLVYGSRVTLYIVVLVLVIAAPIGLLIGSTAGYLGGKTDQVLMRVTDIFFSFPRLVLALAFVASLGPGLNNAIIAIALTAWPAYARVARAETLAVRRSDFISAVRAQGAGSWRIIFRHIMPLSCPRSSCVPPSTWPVSS